MAEGLLKVFVYTGKQTIPIEEAVVSVYKDGILKTVDITDSSGIAGPFEIETPPFDLSLHPQSAPPYESVEVIISSPGFSTAEINGVRIFADRESLEYVELTPLPEGGRSSSVIYNLKNPTL